MEGKIPQTNKKVFNEKYISDGIKDDVKSWNAGDRILIESPTGTGKTTFILNKLIPDIIEHTPPFSHYFSNTKGMGILYLSNRTALSQQFVYELEKDGFIEIDEPDLRVLQRPAFNYKHFNNLQKFYKIESGKTIYIFVLNYQSVHRFDFDYLKNYNIKYVIADEAHFFIEDSTFNHSTYSIWNKILKNCYNSIIIFMSATMDEFKIIFDNDIPRISKELYKPIHPSKDMPASVANKMNEQSYVMWKDICDTVYSKRKYIYVNEYKSVQYTPIAYRNYEDLVDIIAETTKQKGEKWLIFVNSKKAGNNFKQLLQKAHIKGYFAFAKHRRLQLNKNNSRYRNHLLSPDNVKVTSVSSEESPLSFGENVDKLSRRHLQLTKMKVRVVTTGHDSFPSGEDIATLSKETMPSKSQMSSGSTDFMHKLIRESSFDTDVLIATKVIDNGINIKDKALRHIALPFCEKNEFLQMLGRKRFNNDEDTTLNVYIEQPSMQKVNSALFHNASMYYSLLACIIPELRGIHGPYSKYILSNRIGKFNNFRYIKAYQLYIFSQKINDAYKNFDPYYYLSDALEWLDIHSTNKISHINANNCYSFDDILKHIKNNPIPLCESENFYKAFDFFFRIELWQKYSNDTQKINAYKDVRRDKSRRKYAINKFFEIMGLPYEIKSRKCHWVIVDK